MSLDATARLRHAAPSGAWYHLVAPTRLAGMPESMQREVYDFARFLRHKNEDESFNGLLLSEPALGKDWYTPEEDAAWASL